MQLPIICKMPIQKSGHQSKCIIFELADLYSVNNVPRNSSFEKKVSKFGWNLKILLITVWHIAFCNLRKLFLKSRNQPKNIILEFGNSVSLIRVHTNNFLYQSELIWWEFKDFVTLTLTGYTSPCGFLSLRKSLSRSLETSLNVSLLIWVTQVY